MTGRMALFVKFGGLAKRAHGVEVMLNPELGTGLLQEGFDHGARGEGLLRVVFGGGNKIRFALFGIVIEVAAQDDRAGFRELQEKDLMAGRVAGRGHDDHSAVAEDVVGGLAQDYGFAVPERAVILRFGARRGRIGEHDVALGLRHKPGGAGEEIGIADVVPVEMREREVVDVRWFVAGCGELPLSGLVDEA